MVSTDVVLHPSHLSQDAAPVSELDSSIHQDLVQSDPSIGLLFLYIYISLGRCHAQSGPAFNIASPC